MPYSSSTKAKERFRHRKKNRFRDVLSDRIDLNQPEILRNRLNLGGLYSSSLMDRGNIFSARRGAGATPLCRRLRGRRRCSGDASDGVPRRLSRAARRFQTQTDGGTHPGTRRLPARAAQRVLGRGGGRGRGRGLRGGGGGAAREPRAPGGLSGAEKRWQLLAGWCAGLGCSHQAVAARGPGWLGAGGPAVARLARLPLMCPDALASSACPLAISPS